MKEAVLAMYIDEKPYVDIIHWQLHYGRGDPFVHRSVQVRPLWRTPIKPTYIQSNLTYNSDTRVRSMPGQTTIL